jgi:Tfp pilus assembly protein PilN
MRAVNLIPPDQRRGGTPGRTGNAVYFLLGGLAAVALAVGVLVFTGNQIKDRRTELARTQVEATSVEAEAQALKPYADFAALKTKRIQTVEQLAASRFDWPHVLRDLSRAMPRSAWVTTFTGTVAPGVGVEGGGGSSGLRGALPVPAVELNGCADTQTDMARMMTRLRLIEGVTRVSLGSSEKSGATSSGSTGGGASTGCTGDEPQFDVVVFFEGQTTPTPNSGTQTTPAAGGSQ